MNMEPGSKSWFQRWNFRQENINTAQPEQDKEKEFTYLINDRPLNSVKADLIHAFLSVSFILMLFIKFVGIVKFDIIYQNIIINEIFKFS